MSTPDLNDRLLDKLRLSEPIRSISFWGKLFVLIVLPKFAKSDNNKNQLLKKSSMQQLQQISP